VLAIALLLACCGPPPNGSVGGLCRCDPKDTRCQPQVSDCDMGLRCSGTAATAGVCVPVDAGA
jgi:hypothetical protein